MFQTVPCPKMLKRMDEVEDPIDFDLIFAGFPVWQFGPAKQARHFLSRLTKKHAVALFVTHAMDPLSDDPEMKKILDGILQKCREAAGNATITGFFHCRGELSASAANMLSSSGIPMLEKFAGLREETLGHPDEREVGNAIEFCKKIIQEFPGGPCTE